MTVAPLETPDDAVLLGVMEKLFIERNIRPKPDVAAYAIKRIERSVPGVQDLVKRIDEWAGAEKREVTMTLVRRILQIGDEPDYDGMLELFPQNYHEPYYSTYLKEELRIHPICKKRCLAAISLVMLFLWIWI